MAYLACPKCRHAPLPEDQAFPAACPACGLVLAKYAATPARAPRAAASEAVLPDDAAERKGISPWLFYVPEKVAKTNWIARAGTLVGFALWTLWIWTDVDIPVGEVGSTFLHAILIPFHEAGHYAIFRWFGNFIMTLGGTLGQHLMPLVLCLALLVKRRDPFGAALFFWLLGFSVIDMGVYMYDAFDPRMGLIGGGTGADSDGHDWQNLFGDLGLLKRAQGIGLFFGWVGKAMMAAGLAWAAWMVWLQRARLGDPPFAETGRE